MLTHFLPPLAYPFDALEPHIDARTMELHHDRHHQTYITNYTKLLEGTGLLEKYSADELAQHLDAVPTEKKQWVINNLWGHLNHSFFWTILSPHGWGVPVGSLAQKIATTFGGFEAFQQEFTQKALSVFGSGWAWLVQDKDDLLILTHTPGQDSPFFVWLKPIIGIDVWEHAYYLKHQNKRVDYIADFWNVVDWQQAEKYFLGESIF